MHESFILCIEIKLSCIKNEIFMHENENSMHDIFRNYEIGEIPGYGSEFLPGAIHIPRGSAEWDMDN